jgi:hypothetical protein
MNVRAMATLWQHMNFRGGRIRLLFRDLQHLLELFSTFQNTKELNEAIHNYINYYFSPRNRVCICIFLE